MILVKGLITTKDVAKSKAKALLNSVYPSFKNFPQVEKYALVLEIKKTFFDLLKYLNAAENVPSRRKFNLIEADNTLQLLKVFYQISRDQKYISQGFFERIDLELSEIGKLIGGWLKSI